VSNDLGLPAAGDSSFRRGVDDLIILPLVAIALSVTRTTRAVLLFLVRLLDWTFPLFIHLLVPPLFILRSVGDGLSALARAIVAILPLPAASRAQWREAISRSWARIRQVLSYRAFEHAIHQVFEGGMAWTFRKCRNLSPGGALLVIFCAVLWLPISFGAATAIHMVLLAKVTTWPAWMQMLHPFATIVAKSKLLVLPVYPAAWPQARKHPSIQAALAGWHNLMTLYLVRKLGRRYRQMEDAVRGILSMLGRIAQAIGLAYVAAASWNAMARLAVRVAAVCRAAASALFAALSRTRLLGPVLRSYAEQYDRIERPNAGPVSDRLRGFFQRWSIKFSAEYYEAKEREHAAPVAATAPSQGAVPA
jgi:hypothetical protein